MSILFFIYFKRVTVVVHLESAKDSFSARRELVSCKDLIRVEIRGDNDLPRTNLSSGPFRLCCKGIMVCPLEQEVEHPLMLGCHVVQENDFLVLVTIPPLVERFIEQARAGLPDGKRFSRTSGAIMPFVGELIERCPLLIPQVKDLNCLRDLNVIPKRKLACLNHLVWA